VWVCVKQAEINGVRACERARVSAFNRRQPLCTVKGWLQVGLCGCVCVRMGEGVEQR